MMNSEMKVRSQLKLGMAGKGDEFWEPRGNSGTCQDVQRMKTAESQMTEVQTMSITRNGTLLIKNGGGWRRSIQKRNIK